MPDPSAADIEAVRSEIVTKLTNTKKPIIIDSCLDLMLSQITHEFNPELWEMFDEYFSRIEHHPLEALGPYESLTKYFEPLCNRDNIFTSSSDMSQGSYDKDSISLEKSERATEDFRSHKYNDTSCCLPCSCITLSGNRAIKNLNADPADRIKNIEYADAFYDYFLEKTDIDQILVKLLNAYEFEGKYDIPYYTKFGFMLQLMIMKYNRAEAPLTKLRNSTSLKTIGMKRDKNYAGLQFSNMQIVPGMRIVLQLVTRFKQFYDYRKVVLTVERIAGSEQNIAASMADIRKSLVELKRASEKFDYGTNAYNTVNSIGWKLAGFYLVIALSIELQLNQKRFEDIIDQARNMLLFNRRGSPSEKSNTRAMHRLGKFIRDFVLQALAVEEKFWEDDMHLQVFMNRSETIVEEIVASFNEAFRINLADKKWSQEDIVVSHDLPIKS